MACGGAGYGSWNPGLGIEEQKERAKCKVNNNL